MRSIDIAVMAGGYNVRLSVAPKLKRFYVEEKKDRVVGLETFPAPNGTWWSALHLGPICLAYGRHDVRCYASVSARLSIGFA